MGSRGVFTTQSNIYDETFRENGQWLLATFILPKKLDHGRSAGFKIRFWVLFTLKDWFLMKKQILSQYFLRKKKLSGHINFPRSS